VFFYNPRMLCEGTLMDMCEVGADAGDEVVCGADVGGEVVLVVNEVQQRIEPSRLVSVHEYKMGDIHL